MSKNGDESSDSDPPVSEGSSTDGYSDDGIEYRHYINPIMHLVPEENRSYVRKLCKDTARVYAKRVPIKRATLHYPIVEDETKTCMQEDCKNMTLMKCGTCHAFLCVDSKNNCFTKFHDIP
ncbi:uncharacterized protein LOC132940836 [Metopolophium dirhodum]|uniref:uncharacterized protein LOC132940836 n=1 Tax=Metopolophium dirhodum TaxID=44670 RepID=UPI0029905285|nr:uncharacterized protein LOC132940836 [Metopolophium dirhodum]